VPFCPLVVVVEYPCSGSLPVVADPPVCRGAQRERAPQTVSRREAETGMLSGVRQMPPTGGKPLQRKRFQETQGFPTVGKGVGIPIGHDYAPSRKADSLIKWVRIKFTREHQKHSKGFALHKLEFRLESKRRIPRSGSASVHNYMPAHFSRATAILPAVTECAPGNSGGGRWRFADQ